MKVLILVIYLNYAPWIAGVNVDDRVSEVIKVSDPREASIKVWHQTQSQRKYPYSDTFYTSELYEITLPDGKVVKQDIPKISFE